MKLDGENIIFGLVLAGLLKIVHIICGLKPPEKPKPPTKTKYNPPNWDKGTVD